MKNLKRVIEFEHMSTTYMEEQLFALFQEIKGEHQSEAYIHEKIRNVRNHFNNILDNFEQRIMHKEIQKKFLGDSSKELSSFSSEVEQ